MLNMTHTVRILTVGQRAELQKDLDNIKMSMPNGLPQRQHAPSTSRIRVATCNEQSKRDVDIPV